MRRVWHVASSSSEYVVRSESSVGVAEGTMVVEDEFEVAEASKLDGTAS